MRGEFLTSYTPYQAEVSQGYLQAIYEWQTYVALLTGMDVANASVYDGATALAEGVIMAVNATGRRAVLVSRAVHPNYRAVLRTYAAGLDVTSTSCRTAPTARPTSRAARNRPRRATLRSGRGADPEFLRRDRRAGRRLHVAAIKASENGADRRHRRSAVARALATPASVGRRHRRRRGPVVRQRRRVRRTVRRVHRDDQRRTCAGFPAGSSAAPSTVDGRPAFMLTLQAREQHIRREKATSNICTNQAHCALIATIYLAALGQTGLARRRGASTSCGRRRCATR